MTAHNLSCSMIILTTLSILKVENFLHLRGKGIHYLKSKPLISSGRHTWLLIINGCSIIILTTLSILKVENFLHLRGKGTNYLMSKPLLSSGRHTWLLIISFSFEVILTAISLPALYINSSLKFLLKVKNFLHLRGKVYTILCQSPSSLQGDVHDCS